MRKISLIDGTAVAIFAMLCAAFLGFVLNVIKLVAMAADPIVTAMLILRIVGIFVPPLGAILGYL